MAPTYEERFIPRIKTRGLDCEGAAECTTLTTGAGTVGAPAIIAPTDADSGLYWDGKNLRYAADGAQKAAFTTAGAYALALTTGAGTAAAPAINMGTSNTGLFMDSANIGFTVGGVLSKTLAAGQDITVRYADGAKFKGVRANGTYASPTDTEDTNVLFDIVAMGYASSDYHDAAVIRFRQDGALSGINVPCRVTIMSRDSAGNLNNVVGARASGACEIYGALAHQGSTLGFYNTTPTTKPTITGSRGANAALADLLTKLAGLGLLTDSTTA